jgi:SulP family sulfate permease
VLAALLFMRRMAELTDTKLDVGTMTKNNMPDGVVLYEVAGPLFFGAAGRAMGALDDIASKHGQVVILMLSQVPAIDATGLVALETMLGKLRRANDKVILTGLREQPRAILEKAGIRREPGRLAFAPDIETAMSMAIVHRAREAPDFATTPTTP